MIPIFLVALGLASVCLWVYQVFKSRPLRCLRGPPSPSYLTGNEYQLAQREQVGDLEFKWLSEFGSAYRIAGCMGEDILILTDPKGIQHIMHTYRYPKTRTLVNFGRLMGGTGLLGVEGSDHQRQRRVLHPAFSAPNIKAYLPVVQANASKLSYKWSEEVAVGGGTKTVNVNKPLASTLLNMIGEAGFNFQFGSLDTQQESRLAKAYENLFVDAKSHPEKWDLVAQSFWRYVPLSAVLWMLYLPGRQYRRLQQHLDVAMSTAAELLASHVEEKSGLKGPRDILSVLASASVSKDPNTRLEDHEVKSQLATMALAGHETSSNTMSWILYELARHPKIQDDLCQEIAVARAKLVERRNSDFSAQDLEDMTLLNAVIKETLRFHSTVMVTHRSATSDDVIPLAYPVRAKDGTILEGIPVRKGQTITIDLASHNRLPQLWGKDANEWNPYRFMRPDLDTKPSSGGVYGNLMTFGAGIFACIGWRLAVLQLQVMLSELIGKLHFALPFPEVDIVRTPAITMQPMVRGKPELGAYMPLQISLADDA